jgi:DinB superfamily
MAACPECGFRLKALDRDGPNAGTPLAWHYDESGSADAGSRIRGLVGEAANILRLPGPDRLRVRPAPGVWSRLEYACHIRDVLLVQRERVLMVRRGHEDEALPMGRDERVEHDGYNDQQPTDVAVQLEHSALLFDGVLSRLASGDWNRTIVYRFPERTRRSLRWVAVHTEHEVAHHLADIRAQST